MALIVASHVSISTAQPCQGAKLAYLTFALSNFTEECNDTTALLNIQLPHLHPIIAEKIPISFCRFDSSASLSQHSRVYKSSLWPTIKQVRYFACVPHTWPTPFIQMCNREDFFRLPVSSVSNMDSELSAVVAKCCNLNVCAAEESLQPQDNKPLPRGACLFGLHFPPFVKASLLLSPLHMSWLKSQQVTATLHPFCQSRWPS